MLYRLIDAFYTIVAAVVIGGVLTFLTMHD